MSGYHLCQVKKARHPYFIESISTNIFTIEELCFYLEKNIYLLDQTIINEKLLDWIRDELGLVRLYRKLYEQLENEETIGNFILPIFKEIGYLSHDEDPARGSPAKNKGGLPGGVPYVQQCYPGIFHPLKEAEPGKNGRSVLCGGLCEPGLRLCPSLPL